MGDLQTLNRSVHQFSYDIHHELKPRSLIIGIPNVTFQRALMEYFLSEVYGLKPVEKRKLIADYQENALRVVFARARDLPTLLEEKAVDLILCGNDLLVEGQANASILLNTGLFGLLLVLVGQKDRSLNNLVIGSQYPSLAKKLLSRINNPTVVRPINGTAEAWINLDLIDAAIDTWKTGATADANGLGLYHIFRETFLVAAANPLQDEIVNNKALQFARTFELWLQGRIQSKK